MLRWTHYTDGSHSSVTEAHSYSIYPDRIMGKYVLTIGDKVGIPPAPPVRYKVQSLRAIMAIAQAHRDEYLTLATNGSTVLSNTEPQGSPTPERD